MLTHVVLCVAMVISTQALGLPEYIKPCSRSDPNFSECATRNGQIGYPRILNGDRKYHFQSMQPLFVTSLRLDDSKGSIGLVVDMKNISISGFDKFKLVKADADFDEKVLLFSTQMPLLEFICTCDISGKILVLPIQGSGPGNFTFTDFRMEYKVFYELYTKPNGKEYMKITDSDLQFKYDKSYLKLEGLFNGNALLAEPMAAFINDNSAMLVSTLGPSVSGAISSAFLAGFSYVIDKVPFDDIFLP